jgi:ATP-dependent DNA ligase
VTGKRPELKRTAAFIKPMLLLRANELPDGPEWLRELKFDGYRAVAFKTRGKVHLRSRNDNDFNVRYPAIVKALSAVPDETVIDGEIVALDPSGRPSFNLLQNHGSSEPTILYYVFDVMLLAGRDVTGETLESRRALLERNVLPMLTEPIRYSPELPGSVPDGRTIMPIFIMQAVCVRRHRYWPTLVLGKQHPGAKDNPPT